MWYLGRMRFLTQPGIRAPVAETLRCQLPASIGTCVLPAFVCAIPHEAFMLKTKSCMEVVQATKLRVICARDLEQTRKLNGQWYQLSKTSYFSETKITFLGSWAMHVGTCGQYNAGQRASASSRKCT
ncbi:uncharacterized protein LOC144105004 [Amblyomma americanum]